MKEAVLNIRGLVQGVGYRLTAQEKAREFGITGYVKNNKDGTVTVLVQGPRKAVDNFIVWCWQGPDEAYVEFIDVKFSTQIKEKFEDFEIRKE